MMATSGVLDERMSDGVVRDTVEACILTYYSLSVLGRHHKSSASIHCYAASPVQTTLLQALLRTTSLVRKIRASELPSKLKYVLLIFLAGYCQMPFARQRHDYGQPFAPTTHTSMAARRAFQSLDNVHQNKYSKNFTFEQMLVLVN